MAIKVNITKKTDTFELNIDFSSDSKRIGILGASGCGKSMTLKSIAGIEKPDCGHVEVDGNVYFDSQEKRNEKPQNRKVGYLFQNYALFPTMTVEENIAAGIKGDKAFISKRVKEMILRFRLEGLEKRLPGTLSGGQQQRVALARIMAYDPNVILLDEPFSALDLHLRDEMQRELLEMLKDYSGTVILVSHNRDEIYRMSDEVLILEEGKIVRQGKTKEVFDDPQTVAAARITGCKNIFDAKILGIADFEGMIGIRAHHFQLKKTGEEITIPVVDPIVTEDMFEYNISFKTAEDQQERLDWKVAKHLWNGEIEPVPSVIYLNLNHICCLN